MKKQHKLMMAGIAAAATMTVLAPAVNADEVDYTVKSGDTLTQIAETHLGSVEWVDELAAVNGINDVDRIFVGQTLTFDGVKEYVAPVVDGTSDVAVEATYNYDTTAYAYSPVEQEYTYQAPAQIQYDSSAAGSVRLSNGNTAGATGLAAAQEMEARTGVSASTWEYIIARESNGNPNAYNPSGAAGLFQTMPFHGSTATVEDQINSAVNAYNAQGLSAWGM